MKIIETDDWKRHISREQDRELFEKNEKIIEVVAKQHKLRFVYRSFSCHLKQGFFVMADSAKIFVEGGVFKISVLSSEALYDFEKFKKSLVEFGADFEAKTKIKVELIFRG
jgi:hypothetical protein